MSTEDAMEAISLSGTFKPIEPKTVDKFFVVIAPFHTAVTDIFFVPTSTFAKQSKAFFSRPSCSSVNELGSTVTPKEPALSICEQNRTPVLCVDTTASGK
eukprot:TRINITY_DN1683_c0_g2_i3.p1 TRINITY_DN1683_c0_g2~~TRINITY_DN1683_c0_g2_i3.p1  ORF type:complete len:100 (+),score=15.43 TRINITY_DN1683_c0_g2_i3:507-806(+)